ncbi:MAG TPA: potassium-transporting ATPase subunit F [Leptolyngbya sp.]|jgi:K+-transporting ATPase KdpF subunit|nr:potassium-transporting ATPase subunit F [Leptolyngbya sp.]
MKLTNDPYLASLLEDVTKLWSHRYRVPRSLFLMLCLNLVIAPVVQAATGNELARPQAYALGLLGIATIALSIYLFVVMFQPERF